MSAWMRLVVICSSFIIGGTFKCENKPYCKESFCHEDYKKISCDSLSVITVENITYEKDGDICYNIRDDLENAVKHEDLLKNVQDHCRYQNQCSLGFSRDYPQETCAYTIIPEISKDIHNALVVSYKCIPINTIVTDIYTNKTFTNWSAWSRCKQKDRNQYRERNCKDRPYCYYPSCFELEKHRNDMERETRECDDKNLPDTSSTTVSPSKSTRAIISSSSIPPFPSSQTPTPQLNTTKQQQTILPIPSYCNEEVYGNDDFKGRYSFNKTKSNNVVKLLCKYGGLNGGIEELLRTCQLFGSKATWREPDLTKCAAKLKVTNELIKLQQESTTLSNVKNKSSSLTNITEASSTLEIPEEIDIIVEIMNQCLDVTSDDKSVNTDLLKTTNELIKPEQNVPITFKNQGIMLNFLERIGKGSCKANELTEFSGKNLAFKNFFQANTEPLYISAVIQQNELHRVHYDYASIINEEVISSLEISEETFQSFSAKNSRLKMYCYSFGNDKLFSRNSSTEIKSSILDFTLPDYNVKGLESWINIKFHMRTNVSKPSCVYWNKATTSWSTDGCFTTNVTYHDNGTIIECKCNHLTNFAVLLNVGEPSESKVLSIISTIGCIISIVSLSLTLLNLIIFRNLMKPVASKILLNLCLSILLLLLVFIIGIDRTKNMYYCHVISAFIHYFTLSSFAWMAVISCGLYRDVVRTFQYKGQGFNFLWISGVLAWGGPLIIAGITYYFSESQFNETKPTCSVAGNLSLIVTVFPVAMILLFNFAMFIPIIRCIHKHLSIRSKYQSKENYWQRVRVTFGCSLLLGLTWVFGFLAIGGAKTVFEYVFAILNSLQGFFIFVFHTANNTEVHRLWRELFGQCCKDRTKRVESNSTDMVKIASKMNT